MVGGGIYADPYSLGPEASRLSLAGGPHSPLPARADPYGSLYRRGGGGGGGGAGSVRSLTSYSAAALQGELMESGVLYRPGGPLYNDAYAASVLAMGLRVPPPLLATEDPRHEGLLRRHPARPRLPRQAELEKGLRVLLRVRGQSQGPGTGALRSHLGAALPDGRARGRGGRRRGLRLAAAGERDGDQVGRNLTC